MRLSDRLRVRIERSHIKGCVCKNRGDHPPYVVQPWRNDGSQPRPMHHQRLGPGAGEWLRFMCSDPACPSTVLVNRDDLAVLISEGTGWGPSNEEASR